MAHHSPVRQWKMISSLQPGSLTRRRYLQGVATRVAHTGKPQRLALEALCAVLAGTRRPTDVLLRGLEGWVDSVNRAQGRL